MAAVALGLVMGSAIAAEPVSLHVSQQDSGLTISLHAEGSVLAGAVSADAIQQDYLIVPLYSLVDGGRPLVQGSGSGSPSSECGGHSPLVRGSGSGAAGENHDGGQPGLLVQGSGSGAAGESVGVSDGSLLVQGSGSGAAGESVGANDGSLLVQGSGSGAAGESVGASDGSLLVQGSGSGKPESAGDSDSGLLVQGSGSGSPESVGGNGSRLLVQGSGSGAASESCSPVSGAWGIAEVVIDEEGTHVIVHRLSGRYADEVLVAHAGHENSHQGFEVISLP
ncbi:hypothetical protein IC757_12830 [Wenzhouxiangella sp. AB-CW3]|uniref:hypothetical protein n=1 Tax=Wenzhouxiangella sp. AB-CW3 TaxID=2771012 RepID=UPI00168A822E|nr:hypothetical protein [Wenzhouxiangella sp. AB-CW3]QOC21906.1 hypothetical protein IC757_12830 [Wenzhouxiangella sp. AB-CW3]